MASAPFSTAALAQSQLPAGASNSGNFGGFLGRVGEGDRSTAMNQEIIKNFSQFNMVLRI
jgi:hypothetical protein